MMATTCVRSNIFALLLTASIAKLAAAVCPHGTCASSLESNLGGKASLLQQNAVRSAPSDAEQPEEGARVTKLQQKVGEANKQAGVHKKKTQLELKADQLDQLLEEEDLKAVEAARLKAIQTARLNAVNLKAEKKTKLRAHELEEMLEEEDFMAVEAAKLKSAHNSRLGDTQRKAKEEAKVQAEEDGHVDVETEVKLNTQPLVLSDASEEPVVLSDASEESFRMAVVSAQFGLYSPDKPQYLPTPPSGVQCVFYTGSDAMLKNTEGWTIVTQPYHAKISQQWPFADIHSRFSWSNITHTNEKVTQVMAARFYKMNMYLLPELQGIDHILWLDSDRLTNFSENFVTNAQSLLGDYDIVLQKHDLRTSVYQEGWHAAQRAVERTNWLTVQDEITEAWESQSRRGFKDQIGLYDSGAFLFNLKGHMMQSALQAWWREVQTYTFRDQISLPFVLEQFKLSFSAPCQGNCLMAALNDKSTLR